MSHCGDLNPVETIAREGGRQMKSEKAVAHDVPSDSVDGRPLQSADLAIRSVDDPDWLRLVNDSRDATAFHIPAWSSAVSESYGFSSFVLAMQGLDGRVVAGLPVVEVRDLLGRRRLVSLPFTDHCPPLVDEDANLADVALSVTRWRARSAVPRLEVRAELPSMPDTVAQKVGTRHVVDLVSDPDALFRRLHRNRIQKRIRRARELGVEITLSRSIDDLATFYRLHCQTRRRQGVPVQPRRFIRSIWERVIQPGHGYVVLAKVREKPIATALFLTWNRHLIYKYGASDTAYWNLGANFLVHWTAMEWGCVNGYRTYDFGRTDEGHDSLREFKAAWGSTELPLVYTHVGNAPHGLGRGHGASVFKQIIRHSPTVVCRAVGELLYRYAA
jgi:CelD/BcsL family acetyltransferase involved in cellulose biosynthesis